MRGVSHDPSGGTSTFRKPKGTLTTLDKQRFRDYEMVVDGVKAQP
jgi:hypothetical protein